MLHLNLIKEIKSFSKEIKPNKKVDWELLSMNPAAMHLLEKNLDKANLNELMVNKSANVRLSPGRLTFVEKNLSKIDWSDFCYYPHLFDSPLKYIFEPEKNLDKIDWRMLSSNPAAIYLLEKHLDKVNWLYLSQNPAAVYLLEKNLNKVKWNELSTNPAAYHLIKENLHTEDLLYDLCYNRNPCVINLIDSSDNSIDIDYIIEESIFNPAALGLLEKFPYKINWRIFSYNPAIFSDSSSLSLDKNPDKIDVWCLSDNPAAIHLLEEEY